MAMVAYNKKHTPVAKGLGPKREDKPKKQGKPKENRGHLYVYASPNTPDALVDALMKPLPPDISKQIQKLAKKGLRRSKIAKQLKIPTVYVTQELIRLTEPAGIKEHRKKCRPKKKGGAA